VSKRTILSAVIGFILGAATMLLFFNSRGDVRG
jgi:hypothetical protein